MDKTKVIKIFFSITVIALICFATMAPTTREGQLVGKFHTGTSSATLNATNTITGTPFALSGSTGDISIFYQATAGTSTPHYKIVLYGSPDNTTYTTSPIATLTASSDETSTDFIHRQVSAPYMPWGRIDIVGILLNATNTTFRLDIPYQ